ncbi:TetR/AcrR family transcriptional regulator [Phaeovulum sp.]|uniref:TetR/AcrR family transcriptional regulator n=1 Tax=Phaeovulum sp. TaxID=2934796 RepID=UPI0039E59B9B
MNTSTRQPNKAGRADAAETVEKVEDAVLALLAEQGVLAGINLNEVAKAAGVNRSLVYHHFGSRRGLLRSAIRRELDKKQVQTRTPTTPMKLGARVVHALRSLLVGERSLQLTTLLHLDGSKSPRLMPNAETTLLQLERDRALGLVGDIDDLPALHTAYAASVYGYALFREIFARDLGIDVAELDDRVARQFEALFDGIGAKPGGKEEWGETT